MKDRWSSAPYRAVTTETTKPPLLSNAMEAWKARGRELNEIYDALTAVVEEPAPGMDPVADLKALGAQRDRLRAEGEGLRESLRVGRDMYVTVCEKNDRLMKALESIADGDDNGIAVATACAALALTSEETR